MKRRYGRDHTEFRLTEKAQRFYSGCSDITIFEYDDRDVNPETGRLESVYTYSYILSSTGTPTTSSGPESERMSAADLNAELEALADAYEEADIDD